MLLQIGDQDVTEPDEIPTALLWHHGSASGQFVRRDCLLISRGSSDEERRSEGMSEGAHTAGFCGFVLFL